jgi:hypothetical protein
LAYFHIIIQLIETFAINQQKFIQREREREIRKEKANKQADKIKNCYPSGLGYLFLATVRRE